MRKALTLLLALAALGLHAADTLTVDVWPGPHTIEAALQEARLRRLHGEQGVPVLRLHAGTYRLVQPVVLRPEDSGTRIVAMEGAVISGGVQLTGWKRQGRLWVADVPLWNGRPLEFRQLWVNGRKAIRARSVPAGRQGGGEDPFEQMPRIRSVDKAKETVYVNRADVPAAMLSPTAKLFPEMVLHEMWCIANLRVKGAKAQGDSVALTFHSPESRVHFMHPWPSPMVTADGKRNSAFYLTGTRELLDEPGEWWLDQQGQRLYYMPRDGEDMRSAVVEAPAAQTLLRTEGTADDRVTDVEIRGLTFEYATWLRPSLMGHAPLQAGMFMTEAYKIRPQVSRPNGDHKLDNQGWVGRPAAAVTIDCGADVWLRDCTFRHTASTALDFHRFVSGGGAQGCTFTDIGGTAILAGTFGGEGHEAHRPYDPTDRREICTALTLAANRIDDAANEDWGCLGIGAGYVRGISIVGNEVSNVSYTAISMGWGWNQQTNAMADNTVRGNYIHHYARHNYDCAAIYTLGAQPHTVIEDNMVDSICHPSYVHDPDHWFYLYTDEGSSYITVRNNWTPSEKYLRNANGPGNTWENNGPQAERKWRNGAYTPSK